MDTISLNNEFYHCIADALRSFSASAENQAVYAIALDCDASVGTVTLRYRNRSSFAREIGVYEKYRQKYGWAVHGLYGIEYDVGEFDSIAYQKSEPVRHFMDSYYYHEVGDYRGAGEPIEEIAEHYQRIFWDMIVCTIQRLKAEVQKLGIDTTENFIIFHCAHDESQDERKKRMEQTVDPQTIKSLEAATV